MQELIFKNYSKGLFVLIAGIILSSAASMINVESISIPVPLWVLGTVAGFMIGCFVFYPKATTVNTLQVTILGVLINAVILAAAYFGVHYLDYPGIEIKSEFVLYLNPAIVLSGFLFSFLVVYTSVKVDEIIEEQAPAGIPARLPEAVPAKIPVKIPMEIPVEKIPEKILEEIPKELPPEIDKRNEPEVTIDLEAPEEPAIEPETLAPLESADLNDSLFLKQGTDFIPTNIRLVQNVQPKDTDKKGRIGAIGKLLVNNKELSSLDESEEAMLSRANVVTTVSGQKIYEKFDMLRNEFGCIKEMALIDNGGFILANNFEDKQRVQIAGALISGAFHTLQNYLSQAGLGIPVRIFFETDDANSFIAKTSNELIFSAWNKEFDLIEYDQALVPDDSPLLEEVSSAIFENLKVFLMNIQLYNLSRIVIFTPTRTLTITKPKDTILSYLTEASEYPKISEELLKMEEI